MTDALNDLISDAGRAAIAKARGFAKRVVAPNAGKWQNARAYPLEAIREACREGLAEIELAKTAGGQELGFATKLRAFEAIAEYDFAFSFALINQHNATTRIARDMAGRAGTEELIAQMRRGEKIGCTALTEPSAGSDFAAIKARATKDGDGWRLDGAKAWITNAAMCDVAICYAQTDPAAGWRGIAAFLVRADRAGFIREAPFDITGGMAIGVGGFRLENYRAEASDLLQPPGAGFKSAMTGINGARTYVAGMACAMLASGLATAARYGAERDLFGKKLIEHQGQRWKLADIATDLEAARLLTDRAARAVDLNQDAMLPAAYAKKFAVEAAQRGLAACIQFMGAEGLRNDHPLGRHLANAKLAAYTDGSTEIQNERIAQAVAERFGK
ncbi:MAG: acyl-CoA dehydrogenase family protein [Rhodospirillales bacterium]